MFTGAALAACFPTITYVIREIKQYANRKDEDKKPEHSTEVFTDYSEN